jgi:hypothetical protein
LNKIANTNIQKETIINNKKYFNKKFINYKNINTIFDESIKNKIKNKEYTESDYKINIYIMILYLQKKFSNFQINLKFFTYKLKNIEYKQKFKKIQNNILLYNKIIDSNVINYIDYINTEHTINISKHKLRFDIFILLRIDNEYIKIIIETDEDAHFTYNKKSLKYDYYKDKYSIKNGYSMIRINLNKNKLSNEDIKFVLFCINYIIETKKPIYYFSKKYIDYLQSIDNNIYDEFSDVDENINEYESNDDNESNDNNNLIDDVDKYIDTNDCNESNNANDCNDCL